MKNIGVAIGIISFFIFQNLTSKMVAENTMVEKPLPAKRYLALGDSYTIGEGVAANERFPYLTVSLLRQQQISINDPEYIATTGWSTLDLQNAIHAKEPLGRYNVVTLLIGVNDQYRGWNAEGYRIHFTHLLQKAIQLASNQPSRVFVLSIPDYSVTPFVPAVDKTRVRNEIDQFNKINKQVTDQNGVAYLDITPLTREAATAPSLLANDGLHYSGKEYQLWAERLVPMMKHILLQ